MLSLALISTLAIHAGEVQVTGCRNSSGQPASITNDETGVSIRCPMPGRDGADAQGKKDFESPIKHPWTQSIGHGDSMDDPKKYRLSITTKMGTFRTVQGRPKYIVQIKSEVPLTYTEAEADDGVYISFRGPGVYENFSNRFAIAQNKEKARLDRLTESKNLVVNAKLAEPQGKYRLIIAEDGRISFARE